jgi:hypothetical protein
MIAESLFCQHRLATLGAYHLAAVAGSLVDVPHFQRGAITVTEVFRAVVLCLTLRAEFHGDGLSSDGTQVPTGVSCSPEQAGEGSFLACDSYSLVSLTHSAFAETLAAL